MSPEERHSRGREKRNGSLSVLCMVVGGGASHAELLPVAQSLIFILQHGAPKRVEGNKAGFTMKLWGPSLAWAPFKVLGGASQYVHMVVCFHKFYEGKIF